MYRTESHDSVSTLDYSRNKLYDESITHRTSHSTVTCTYLTYIGGIWRNTTVLWCKNVMTHCLTISIDGLDGDCQHSCKIDLKSWHFWSKKGYKIFELDDMHVDVYWDMRSVKYSGSSEPYSDYYVALVSEEEVVLLLGDYNKKAYKKTKSRPALTEPVLCNKIHHVFNRKCFMTRARFDQRKKEHDIVIESSTSGTKDPEMSITVDGNVAIHIRNLQWKFRGNQLIVVNNIPVQVFWDVHAWFFPSTGSGNGWFIFKPGASESECDQEGSSSSRNYDYNDTGSANSQSRLSLSHIDTSDFCLILFAWKLE